MYDGAYGRAGEYWPDPLIPDPFPYTCPAGENCPFWVLVYVPATTEEGTYEGHITMKVGGYKLGGDVKLTVWNFTIPKNTKLKSIMRYDAKILDVYHHMLKETRDTRFSIYRNYLGSYSKHRLSPQTPFSPYSPYGYYNATSDEYHVYFKDFKNIANELYSEDGFGFSSSAM